uniref:Uncharacterized protein n=1 Tax=Timema bartmani TaxID=61472 RepID=A0A7R9F0C9_9NEOP|nr:unnamed protein product [Timema bartmani]
MINDQPCQPPLSPEPSGFGQTDKRASERASDWVARLASVRASSGKSFGELLVSGGAVSTDTAAETPLPPTVAPTSAGLLQVRSLESYPHSSTYICRFTTGGSTFIARTEMIPLSGLTSGAHMTGVD